MAQTSHLVTIGTMFVSQIIADNPTKIDKWVQQINQHIDSALSFIGHMAANHPNEFLTAIATIAIACFTAILAIATIRLWNSTADLVKFAEEQSRLTLDSIELARKEFISMHRPKIILREAYTLPLQEGHPIYARLHFANIGDTPGKIVGSILRTHVLSGKEGPPVLTFDLDNDLDVVDLFAGGSMLIPYAMGGIKWEPAKFNLHTPSADTGVKPYWPNRIYLVGQFIYIDDLQISRRTAFCRVLIPDRERFYRIPDEPDLDYSD